MLNIVTQDSLRKKEIERMIRVHESKNPPQALLSNREALYAWEKTRAGLLSELYNDQIPYYWPHSVHSQVNLAQAFTPTNKKGVIAEANPSFGKHLEAISEQTQGAFNAGAFFKDFYRRREYEVEMGRREVPAMYPMIYNVVRDRDLPEYVDIFTMEATGVVFEEIKEGGHVAFATVGQGTKAVRIKEYAAGLQYSRNFVLYNKVHQMAETEREFGKAHSALMNNVHFSPILTHTYTGTRAISASSEGTTLVEKTMNTLSDAIAEATKANQDYPIMPPYILICNTANLSMIERAITGVPTLAAPGVVIQAPEVPRQIQTVIAYDGWTGQRGNLSTTYTGVTANTCYLVGLQHRTYDWKSYIKVELDRLEQPGDKTRLIEQEVVFDTHFGVYAAPAKSALKITLPTGS